MEHATTTSDMRVALCEAICLAVMNHGDHADKTKLGRDLDALPFERRTDDALVDMAREWVDAGTVDRIVERKSRNRYECTELFLCPTCRDARFVPDDDGRLDRCEQCNPRPEPEEPKATKRGRR